MWGLRISLLRSATLCYFKSDVSDTRNTFASPTLPLESTRSCASAIKQLLLERFTRLVLGRIRTLPPIELLRAVPVHGAFAHAPSGREHPCSLWAGQLGQQPHRMRRSGQHAPSRHAQGAEGLLGRFMPA